MMRRIRDPRRSSTAFNMGPLENVGRCLKLFGTGGIRSETTLPNGSEEGLYATLWLAYVTLSRES